MKTVQNAKTIFVFAAVALIFWGMPAHTPAQVGGTVSYCEMKLAGCPQDYHGRELVVPNNVIAMSAQIQACGIADSAETGGGGVPAVMFVIDHSRSMSMDMSASNCGGNGGSNGHDPAGNRFRVTRALIDSIYKTYPQAEVGMVFFGASLVLNSGHDPRLENFAGTLSSTDRAFMPLQRLNDTLNIAGNNSGYYNFSRSGDAEGSPTVRGLYSSMFNIPDSGNATLVRPNPSNSNPNRTTTISTNSGTDISLAFEAALQAFEATNISKDNQYIIFISDGEAGNISAGRQSMMNNYINGENTPTTYTIYLSECDTPPWPQTLLDMNENIKNNIGYSATNATSFIEILAQARYEDLLELMMDKIITPMLSKTEGDAKRIVITSGGRVDSTTNMTDGNFVFRRQLPIDVSEITTVEMNIRYDVRVDSTWTLPNGADTTATVRIVPDSLFEYSFTVRRDEDPPMDWRESQDLIDSCGSTTLDLQYQGASLIGSEVKGFMDILTIRFDNTGGLFNYDFVIVDVMNADGTFSDAERITLSRNGDIWTGDFGRTANTSGARSGDGILQHTAQDSIVVVFRNPDFPLDTLRISVPYVSTTMAFYDRPGDPRDADTLGAIVPVTAGDSLNIYAKFFDHSGVWDQSFENDPSKITWTVMPELAASGVHGVFYSETAGQYHVTAKYEEGSMTIEATVTIIVEPGPLRYLQVVLDSTRVEARVRDTNSLKEPTRYEFEKDKDNEVFYVIARDKFGNIIPGGADSSEWDSSDKNIITATGRGSGTSADITRHGSSTGDGLRVTVEKNGIIAIVDITIVGDSNIASGPNPFVPGRDSPEEWLTNIGLDPGSEAYRTYKDIIDGRSPGGGTVSGANTSGTGVLIAATAPRTIQVSGGRARATIIIYDAVGNIVYRSSDLAVAEGGNTFGLVWNGKNSAGRTVGPGTYLVRMAGTMSNGHKFNVQRRIGVTR